MKFSFEKRKKRPVSIIFITPFINQEIKRLNEENEKLRDRLKSTEQKTSAFLEEKSRMRDQLEKMQNTMKSQRGGGVREIPSRILGI